MFRKDVWTLIREFFSAIVDCIKGKPNFKTPERRFLLMVIIGSIPVAIAGMTLTLLNLDTVLENIFVAAAFLIVTAVLMFIVDKIGGGNYTEKDAPLKTAWIVGISQAIAIFPGLSRSGSTIFGGLMGGLSKEFAVRYSFILSIPTILGAGLVSLFSVPGSGDLTIDPLKWTIGFVVATVCGIFAIKFIKVLIKSKKFYIFGIYCLLASAFAFLIGFGVIG